MRLIFCKGTQSWRQNMSLEKLFAEKDYNSFSFARIFLLKFLLHVPTKDKMRVVSLNPQGFGQKARQRQCQQNAHFIRRFRKTGQCQRIFVASGRGRCLNRRCKPHSCRFYRHCEKRRLCGIIEKGLNDGNSFIGNPPDCCNLSGNTHFVAAFRRRSFGWDSR